MCGILIVHAKNDRLDQRLCDNAMKRLALRGPDYKFQNIYNNGTLFFGQTVLSITGNPNNHLDIYHHSSDNIKVAFFLNFAFTILEIIGGLYVNSIAIISDAIHDLGDTISLGTSWYLEEKSHKKSNKKFSFGYKRFSLLGALINLSLIHI